MGKIIRLTETDLTRIVKRVISQQNRINEVSSDLFKSAIDKTYEKKQRTRKNNLSKLFLDEFVGEEFDGGVIKNITIHDRRDDFTSDSTVINTKLPITLKLHITIPEDKRYDIAKGSKTIDYDYVHDEWTNIPNAISRKDANLLYKIASKLNPDTKYRDRTGFFRIKGIHTS
jgi:hypothetical protein